MSFGHPIFFIHFNTPMDCLHKIDDYTAMSTKSHPNNRTAKCVSEDAPELKNLQEIQNGNKTN